MPGSLIPPDERARGNDEAPVPWRLPALPEKFPDKFPAAARARYPTPPDEFPDKLPALASRDPSTLAARPCALPSFESFKSTEEPPWVEPAGPSSIDPEISEAFASASSLASAAARSPTAMNPASRISGERIVASNSAAEAERYDSANLAGENAASLGMSSVTLRRTMRSLLSCKRSTVSATSLYRDSINSPVCRSISPNANRDPCVRSTDGAPPDPPPTPLPLPAPSKPPWASSYSR